MVTVKLNKLECERLEYILDIFFFSKDYDELKEPCKTQVYVLRKRLKELIKR